MIKKIIPWFNLVIACLVFNGESIHAQKVNAAKAFEYLSKGNYEKAHAAYGALLKVFPNEPLYQYGAGMSLVHLNRDLESAIQHLTVASAGNVPVDVYFYLGMAYHNRCNFAKALQNYQRFKQYGQIMEIRRMKVDQYIRWCENGLKLSTGIHDVDLLFFENITKDILEQVQHEIAGLTTIIIPATISPGGKPVKTLVHGGLLPGDLVFFSASSGFLSKNKNIYQVKYLGKNNWGKAIPLDKTINTSSDESFPFFDKENNTLYFSSNGHQSIGGFDLFSINYNKHARKWMKVKSLGIPYNSPYDDLLIIQIGGIHYFTSNRLGGLNRDDFFAVKQPRDGIPLRYPLPGLVHDAIRLGISPASHASMQSENSTVKEKTKTQFPQHDLEKKYAGLLDQAMELQLKADSFMTEAGEIKNSTTIDHAEKHRLIKKHHDLATRHQIKSEVKYTEAREIEKKLFALNKMGNVRETNGPKNPATEDGVKTSNNINYFEILLTPPYDASNPFPSDIGIPRGLIYRIQLGVFRKPLPHDYFHGLVPVTTEFLEDKELTRYYLGVFDSYEKASSALAATQGLGFTDAYIVAFYDQTKISLKRARSIELHD